MNPERVASEARRSISSFCYDECRSYCCRKGFLTVAEAELPIITQGRQAKLEREGRILTLSDGFSLNLEGGCPSLKEFRCTIHASPKRPKACREYPIWVRGGIIFVSPRCLAVRQGLLYSYVRRLREAGYRIIDSAPYATLDLHHFEPPQPLKT